MNEIEIRRTPEIIGGEIRGLTQQARSMTLWYGIEIGRRLVEAKELLGHGEWLPFLKEQTEYSQPSASRLMTLYKEYGSMQTSLFGAELNYSTLNNLSISNALRLIAIPEDEREDFAREHDVEHLSSRELETLLREKTEAIERAEKAEAELAAADEGSALKIGELESRADEAEEKAKRAKMELKEAEKAERDAKDKLIAAERELKELRERPVEVAVQIDESAVAAAREETKAEYEATLKESTEREEKLKSDISKLREKIKEEQEKAAEAVKRAEELRRQGAMSDPDTANFKLLFEAVQSDFNKLFGTLAKVRERDGETADKLTNATLALIKQMQGRLG